MSYITDMLERAGKIALPTFENDLRDFYLGCIGERRDGVLVKSKNGAYNASNCSDGLKFKKISDAHSETRVLKKLGKNGILYVSRIAKGTKLHALARPCPLCRSRIKIAQVQRVYYTIDENHYGIWLPDLDVDKIYEL